MTKFSRYTCTYVLEALYSENMRPKEAICWSIKFSVVAARVAAVAAAAVITAQLPNTAIVVETFLEHSSPLEKM